MQQIGYKGSELGIVVTQFTSSSLLVEHPLLVKYSKLRRCTSAMGDVFVQELACRDV